MNLYDGSLAGAMSVNANGNAITLRENLSGISINPLLKDLADKDLIEGHGDVRLDVTHARRNGDGHEEGARRHRRRGPAATARSRASTSPRPFAN